MIERENEQESLFNEPLYKDICEVLIKYQPTYTQAIVALATAHGWVVDIFKDSPLLQEEDHIQSVLELYETIIRKTLRGEVGSDEGE